MKFLKLTLLVALFVLSPAVKVAGDNCEREDVSFSITSRRNLTGHWIVNVAARQREPTPGVESGPWHLDVQARGAPPCVARTSQLEAHLTVAPMPARPGYELQPALGSRYKLHMKPVTWEEARSACAEEAAHLAVINGDSEATTLRELFARHPRINNTTWEGAAWVGFDDQHTEGEYLTVLGQRVEESGYNKWISGQPDNKDYKMPPDVDSDCGGIHRNALLDDLPCSARYVFICEQEMW